ncbi:uncharacterized protein LOC133782247 [Humulus lupulus]|uniref:uncharacterized protein LOC133782247 n=1 Tax=Humulus lupulus TaxID=3486 RepID=UPI002B40F7CE|nr:uncharacterized protein LOC133782247 [Humulus lupulus]
MTLKCKRGGVGKKLDTHRKNDEDGDLGTCSMVVVKKETSKLENLLTEKRRLENALMQKELATKRMIALKTISIGKSKKGKEMPPVDFDDESEGEDQDDTEDDDAETEVDTHEIESREIMTRWSFERVSRIVNKLSDEQKAMVHEVGFGAFLRVDFPSIYTPLAQWLVESVDVENSCMKIYGKMFPISGDVFQRVMTIPDGKSS